MINDNRSKEEILIELEQLQLENANLRYLYERDINNLLQSEKKRDESLSILEATLESIDDAILVTDLNRNWILKNKQFTDLWKFPNEILGNKEPGSALNYVRNQSKNPEEFSNQLNILFEHNDCRSFDIIELIDGRIIERFSIPQILNGDVIGRIFSFHDITEKIKSDTIIRESEQKFKNAFQYSSIGMALISPDGKWLQVNSKICSIVGYSESELLNLTYQDITHSDDIESNLEYVRKILNNEISSFEIEKRYIHKSNDIIWVLLSVSMVRDIDNNPLFFISQIVDITEKKRKDEEIAKLQLALDSSVDSIFITDKSGIITYINHEFTELYGYTKEEVIGIVTPRIIKSGLMPQEIYSNFWNTILSGEIVKGELVNKTKNGRILNIEGSANPIKNNNNEIIGFLAIQRDISQRKKAELINKILFKIANTVLIAEDLNSLFETVRNELNTIIDTTNFFIAFYDKTSNLLTTPFEIDENGSIPVWSAEKSLTGLVVHQKRSFLLKKEDILDLSKSGQINLLGSRSESWLGTPLKIGERVLGAIVVQSYTNPEAYDQSSIDVLELIANNLSIYIEHKKAESDLRISETKLKRINSEKDKFFSIIAHDLKTPFNGFLGLTKILSEEINNLTLMDMQDLGKSLQESATNLYKLLENLLEWSRIQRGVTQFNPEQCIITYIVSQNIQILTDNARLKNIEFINNISESALVIADIPMLNTVFRNLMSNALKFTKPGGSIIIGVDENYADNNYVCIYVKDNGIGMHNDILNKLFKIDQKVSREGTNGESSTGLGLLLCKDFIEKNNGNIWVESTEFKGSTFFFTLPL